MFNSLPGILKISLHWEAKWSFKNFFVHLLAWRLEITELSLKLLYNVTKFNEFLNCILVLNTACNWLIIEKNLRNRLVLNNASLAHLLLSLVYQLILIFLFVNLDLSKSLLNWQASNSFRVTVSILLLMLSDHLDVLRFLRVIFFNETFIRNCRFYFPLNRRLFLLNFLLSDFTHFLLGLGLEIALLPAWDIVNILEMSPKVATLSKSLLTETAGEWSLTCMLSEMISQITALFEDTVASRVLTLEK